MSDVPVTDIPSATAGTTAIDLELAPSVAARPPLPAWRATWRRFRSQKLPMFALILIVVIAIASLAAPLIAPMTGVCIDGHRGEMSGSCVLPPSSLRSRPAQNTGSAPVRITTSTSSSAYASCNAA